MKKLNLIGKTFGRLSVIEEVGKEWLCICSCGSFKRSTTQLLNRGAVKSCGCLKFDCQSNFKHGYAVKDKNKRPNEYNIWLGIKRRCNNPKDPAYKNYGGRGITICDRWLESFENFLEDMGFRPSPKHSIDRIDNDGNYCKENCRWVTREVQSINKRSKRSTTGIKGVHFIKRNNKYIATIGVNNQQIHLGTFNTKEEAMVARKAAEEKYHKPLLKNN